MSEPGLTAPPAQTAVAGVTVLYIEDNRSNVALVQRILARRPGVTLLVATHGEAGLEMAGTSAPALILLDLHLPDIAGEEVLRRLRQDPQTAAIPVVVISADAIPAQVERLQAAGAHAYLTKPLDVARFLAILDRLLGQRANL